MKRFRNLSEYRAGADRTGAWARPADWLPPPVMTSADEKVCWLIAVDDSDANYVFIQVSGNVTVDWGDGSAPENFVSGAIAGHKYAWGSLSAGTLTSEGFRQAMLTITPQAGHQLVTAQVYFNAAFVNASHDSPVIEAWVSMPNANATNLNSMFANRCDLLRHVHFYNIGGATSFSSTFSNCFSLEEVTFDPNVNTAVITSMASMFQGCSRLRRAPFLNTGSVTTMAQAFYACPSLREVPEYNTASVTAANSIFGGCRSLGKIPRSFLNMPEATTVAGIFQDCSSLEEVGDISYPKATTVAQLFQRCAGLKRVGDVYAPLATSASEAFATCTSLHTIGTITLSASLSTISAIFYLDSALTSIPLFNTAAVTTASYAFSGTLARTIPAFDLSSATTVTDVFGPNVNFNCQRIKATGMKETFSILNCALGAAELNELYTNLATVVGKTITVTGNPGVTGDDPSIATAKGWTVTG